MILNSDSLEYMKGLKDNTFDLIFTDPPYGIGADNEAHKRSGTKRGNASWVGLDYEKKDWDNETPSKEFFDEIIRVSKHQIIFGGNYFTDKLPQSNGWIVWDKKTGENAYSDCELLYTSFKERVKEYVYLWSGFLQQDMKEKDTRFHPTQKPVKLCQNILRDYINKYDINTIFDPFMGSGSLLIAGKSLGLTITGCELDKDYFDIAKNRLDKVQKVLF